MIVMVLEWLASYLLGSAVGALLLGRWRGVDIRTLGSGNAGATNALRTQGKAFALAAGLFDAGKGVVAALLIAGSLGAHHPAQPLWCAAAAVLGHCFPVWHGFRGGKGAATLFAAVLVLYPKAALLCLSLWILCVLLSGYVGLSTVLAALALPPALLLTGTHGSAVVLSSIGLAALLVVMHRGNLQRLRQGTEHRFRRLWQRKDLA